MKTLSLHSGTVIATLFLANIAQAADITWQTPQAISSALDVNTQGTLVTSKSTGYGYTVNGVFFNPAAANFSENFTRGDANYMGGQTFIGTNNADGQAYAGLMDIAHAFNGWGNATATITFSNLTVGQQYLVQFWVADYRGYPNDRYVTLTGGASASGQLKFLDSDNSNGGIHGSYVIGTFTADATSQAILINSNECTMMQAVQLRTNLGLADADGIWTGANGNWGDATNWDANTIAHGVDKSATFNGLTPVSVTVDAGHPIGALNFSGANHTIAAGAGSLTLDINTVYTSPTVTVAPGITATIGAQLTGNEGLTKTDTGTLVLSGSRTYTGGTNVNQGTLKLDLGASSGNAALGSFSVASGATLNLDNTNTTVGSYFPQNFVLSGSGTLSKNGVGSIDLWTGSNLTGFTGTVDVQQGALRLNNIATNGNMWQATLNIASGATFDVRYNASLSVDQLTGSGTLDQSYNGGSGLSVTVGSNDGSSSFSGVIQNSSGQPLSLTKAGIGTFTLTGAHTYTGTTTVQAGTLSLAQAFLNDNAAVVIGLDGILHLGFSGTDVVGSLKIEGIELPPGVYNSSHPVYGPHFTGTGSLEVLGVDGTWTSLVNADWSDAIRWDGNSVASGIDSIATFSAATGVTVNLDSNRPIGGLVFGTTGYTLAGSSTLTLNTTSDISTITVDAGLAATISARLASSDALRKAGDGTLTLSAQNNFSNAISVSKGTLELATDWTFGNAGTGTPIVPGLVTVESGATLRAVNSLANQLNGLALNGGTVEAVGVGNADWGNFHLTGNVTVTGTSNLNAEVALRAANVDFFVDGGAALNVGGVMHNGAFYGIYFGAPANVSKSGDGTMVLSATNTYTGNTTVDAGTLQITNTGSLRFRPTSNGTTNFVSDSSGAGTLSFLGTVNLDLSAAEATIGNSWTLFNLGSYTGLTPTAVTSTLGSFNEVAPGTWERSVSGAKWVFTETNGTLAYVNAATPYETWGSTYGLTAGSEGADLDNDGLTNFQEFAFGLIPNSGSSVNPITSPLDKTTGKFSYTRHASPSATGLTYKVWTSTDLATWNEDAAATASQTVTGTAGDIETVEATLTGTLPLAQPKLFIQVRAE